MKVDLINDVGVGGVFKTSLSVLKIVGATPKNKYNNWPSVTVELVKYIGPDCFMDAFMKSFRQQQSAERIYHSDSDFEILTVAPKESKKPAMSTPLSLEGLILRGGADDPYKDAPLGIGKKKKR
ncbi:hypothetical protein KC921_02810 [Candidatus Woesebacteria bacterium]|nr:hypothetical protein [Candidatus Woesebacteria bacterium]